MFFFFRPEKYWLASAGLLPNYLFDLNFIFLSGGFMVAVEQATGFYLCRLPLAGTIPRRWRYLGQPDWHEASPGLSPAKRCRQRSATNSTLANMVANSRILPKAAGRFWRCRLTLNLQKEAFSVSIHFPYICTFTVHSVQICANPRSPRNTFLDRFCENLHGMYITLIASAGGSIMTSKNLKGHYLELS